MSLRTEELGELTRRVNDRLLEFGEKMFEPLTLGHVRLVAEEVMKWQLGNPDPNDLGHDLDYVLAAESPVEREKPLGDPMVDGYSIGYAAGYVRAYRDALHPSEVIGTPPDVPDTYPDGAPRARFDADDIDRQWERDGDEQADALEAQAVEEDRLYREAVEELVGGETVAEFLANDQPKDAAGMPSLSPRAAATLGPEHTVVTPLRPIISGARLPDPDDARDRLAIALANGGDDLRVRIAASKPRTLAEVVANGAEDEDGDREPEIEVGDRVFFLPSRKQVIAELKRQSMAGMMPTQAAFNVAKPTNWALAASQCVRLQVSWIALAHEAGLTPGKRGPAANGASA